MVHAHITAWFLALVLFFIAFSLYKGGNQKGAKIVHMILRLFYILVFLSGGMLIVMTGMYIFKAIVGLWLISAIELILVRTAKNKNTSGWWIQFAIAIVLVLYLGLSLPMGFDFF